MAINIRRVGEVADGAITNIKLADGAVDLDTPKVVGQLPTSKMKDGAVVENKLASLAISTGKLQDGVINLAKANDDIRSSHFAGDETIVSHSGTDEHIAKEFTFPKKTGYSAKKLRFFCTLKVGGSGETGYLKVYIDSEPTPRLTFSSTSLTYELLSDEVDISDIGQGLHKVTIKISCDASGETVHNDMIDALLIKGD